MISRLTWSPRQKNHLLSMHVNRLCWWTWMSLFETARESWLVLKCPFVQHQTACLAFSALCDVYICHPRPLRLIRPPATLVKPGPHVTQPEILGGFIFQCEQCMDGGLHETASPLISRAALRRWSRGSDSMNTRTSGSESLSYGNGRQSKAFWRLSQRCCQSASRGIPRKMECSGWISP